jgi:hypothetical protein
MKIDLSTLLLVGGGIAAYHYSTLSKEKQKEIKQKLGLAPKYTEPEPPVVTTNTCNTGGRMLSHRDTLPQGCSCEDFSWGGIVGRTCPQGCVGEKGPLSAMADGGGKCVPGGTTTATTPSKPINWCGTGRFPVSMPGVGQVCAAMPSAETTMQQAGFGVQSAPIDVQLPPATTPQSQADCAAGLVFNSRYPCGIPGCDWINECITPEDKALRDAAPLPPSARPMGFSGFTGINNEHQPGNFLTDDPGDIQSMTEFINDVP